MKRTGRLRALALSIAVFAVTPLVIALLGHLSGQFRIDEAHKISETVFLRLVQSRDFTNALWFANRVDRSNPPVGKYALGLAIQLSGEALPDGPTLAAEAVDDYIPPLHPPELSQRYAGVLGAARRASVAATAATAALLAWIVARVHGVWGGIIAVTLHLTNYLTQTFWATAIFDPILTFFIVATLVPLRVLWNEGRLPLQIGNAMLLGTLAAFAFQTRLSGAVALVAACATLLANLKRSGSRALIVIGVTVATFLLVSVAVNPFYWAAATGDAGSAITRPIARVQQQLDDLGVLLEKTKRRTPVFESTGEKTEFFFQIVFGDLPGLLLLTACAIAVVLAALRFRTLDRELRLILFWAASVVAIITLWLPVAWPRYLHSVVPPLSIIGSLGVAELASRLRPLRAETER